MNIGEKLKQLREDNNMTRKEVADKLKKFDIDISDKTLYGYESGRNSTNADMFLALCQIYKCNNIMGTFSNSVDDILFTNSEWEIISKYRSLDPHGQDMVDTVLNKEFDRCEKIKKEQQAEITSLPDRSYLEPVAAHERTDIEVTGEMRQYDDDLMNNNDLWK